MNEGFFSGRIIKPPKYARGKNGQEYVSLFVEENKQETYRGYHPIGHFSCFMPKVLRYLKDLNLKVNDYVVVTYKLDNFFEEVKGKSLFRTGVIAEKVYVIKLKTDNN